MPGETYIGLHASSRNQFYKQWMRDRDRGDQGAKLIAEIPGIGGRF
ncbi:hypothetical protein [Ktedonobacter sp. SOSP1-52]|nr:hypothetical protein [Ktedonobacter sp. SOSP1-52]